jgi:hypothetical protein
MRTIAVLLGLLICTGLWAQTKILIPEPYGDHFIESELISEVSYIPLQMEKFGMITSDMELKVDGDDYFILDNRNTQCVFRFGADGSQLNNICEEKPKADANNLPVLSNPAKFNLNPFIKQIEIYNFENSLIQRFAYDGKSRGKISFEVNPSDFVRDQDGNYWIYMGWHNSESQYRLLKADGNGKVQERKMRLISNSTPTEGFAFYLHNTDIYLWELLGNTVYMIRNNEVTPAYLFDFGIHNLPLNYHLMKADDSFKYINEAGYYTVKKFVGNEQFSYIFLNYTSLEQREMFHVIHDKQAAQVFVYTENSAIGAFDKAQAITENNELIFLVAPRKVRQLLSGGSEFVPAPFMDIVENLGNERNPVILKVKLQSMATEVEEYNSSDSQYFGD